MKLYYFALIVICLGQITILQAFAQVAQWNLDGNLLSSTGNPPLIPSHLLEDHEPEVKFVKDTINGISTEVMYFGKGTFFKLYHNFLSDINTRIDNQYTILMDIKIPKSNGGRIGLMNIDTKYDAPNDFYDEADWMVGRYGEFAEFFYGFHSGVFREDIRPKNIIRGSFQYNQWNRIALTYHAQNKLYRFFCDGIFEQSNELLGIDVIGFGNPILLFADINEYSDGYVSCIQIVQDILTDETLKELGTSTAGNIPFTYTNDKSSPYIETVYKPTTTSVGQEQTIQWQSNITQGIVRVELCQDESFYQHIGYQKIDDRQFTWPVSLMTEQGSHYQIKVIWLHDESMMAVSEPFTIHNPSSPLNKNYGINVIQNNAFIDGFSGWDVVSGSPSIHIADQNEDPLHRHIHMKRLVLDETGNEWKIRQTIHLDRLGIQSHDIQQGLQYFYGTKFIPNIHYNFNNTVIEFYDDQNDLLHQINSYPHAQGLIPISTRYIQLSIATQNPLQIDHIIKLLNTNFTIEPVSINQNSEIAIGPYIEYKDAGTMRIFWSSESNLHYPTFSWGKNDLTDVPLSKIYTSSSASWGYIYHTELENLNVNEKYQYQVGVGNNNSEIFEFIHPDLTSNEGNIALYGNSADYIDTFTTILERLSKHKPFMLLTPGRMEVSTFSSQKQYHYTPLTDFDLIQSIPHFYSLGTLHSHYFLGIEEVIKIIQHKYRYNRFPNYGNYYSIRLNHSEFIFVNSDFVRDLPNEGNVQTEWLIQHLEKESTQNADFRIVLFAEPPFTDFYHNVKPEYNGSESVRKYWVPLFEKYNIDLVINADVDYYLRGDQNGVRYTIIGGAGGIIDDPSLSGHRTADWGFWDQSIPIHHYVIMQIKNQKLFWTAYDLEDNEIDHFVMDSKKR